MLRAIPVGVVIMTSAGCTSTARPQGPWSEGMGAATTSTGSADHDGGQTQGTSGADDTGGLETSSDSPVRFDAGSTDLDPEGETCGCAPGNDAVYVLSSLGEIWRFEPGLGQFEFVGAVDCPVFSSVTFSLAVDRAANAYVQFRSTGDVFVVPLSTFDCEDPGYEPSVVEPRRFGMGFVAAEHPESSTACEQMLGLSFDGTQWSEGPGVGSLVRFEGPALHTTVVADLDFNGGEFAGTGDGRLFAFAGAPQAKLLQLDPGSTDVIESTVLPGIELTDAFAMAFWGGDFYFFVDGGGGASRVLRLDYDGSDGSGQALSVAVDIAPILVVGAASSTCAPTQPAG